MRSGITHACPIFLCDCASLEVQLRRRLVLPSDADSAEICFFERPGNLVVLSGAAIAVVVGHPWTDALNNPLQPIMESLGDRPARPLDPTDEDPHDFLPSSRGRVPSVAEAAYRVTG
jgi:hypothetical protein